MSGPQQSAARLALGRLWVLMVTAFVDMLGFALILPLLPLYATRYGAPPVVVGLLMAAFAFAQLLTAPLWGRLSDRAGRRPVIIGGQCLAAIAFAIFAVADSVWLLLLCRLVQGAGGGTVSVNQAYVGDVAGPQDRARALGWITACSSLGVMIGPAIASFSFRFSESAPGMIAAALSALNVLFAWRWLPEPLRHRHAGQRRRRLRQAVAAVARHPFEPPHLLVWIYATGMMAFMAMNAVMALFLALRFGIDERSIGWFYVAVGSVSVVMRALILGSLVRRFGEVRVLRAGGLLLAAGMVLAPFAATPAAFLLAIVLVPAGTALLFPSTTSLVSRLAPSGELGQTLGVQQAFGGTSRLLGPIWAGAVFQHAGPQATFWLAGGVVLAAVLAALRLHPGEAPRREVEVVVDDAGDVSPPLSSAPAAAGSRPPGQTSSPL
ncbi:MAG: MFS transporter [Acidobacteria bacterium]|nr:MAG: MFS transporter [Acidobacteriota bacterium]